MDSSEAIDSYLYYCGKQLSNHGSSCSNLAKYNRTYFNTKTGEKCADWRCEKHKHSNMKNKEKMSFVIYSQASMLRSINIMLEAHIGKNVFSRFHKNKYSFTGKFLTKNGAIMCQDNRGQWKCVYYNQLRRYGK